MAMPELSLLWLGGLAVLVSSTLFREVDERWTELLLTFLAAVLWGMFGLSAYDVTIDDAAAVQEPIMEFVVLGIGLSLIIALLGFWRLLRNVGAESQESDVDLLG